jgi:transcriptional regulator with XRE-family HTH domain
MRKALREADLGVQEMADYLGVTRSTVSTWINGRIPPSTQTLRLWALRTHVSYEWLAGDETGPRPGLPTTARRFRTAPIQTVTPLGNLHSLDYHQLAA